MNIHDLRSVLSYIPDTGEFFWIKAAGRRVKAGDAAGSFDKNGYRHIQVFGKRYLAHRLAWIITHGEWPKSCIDHINRNPSDNRLCNLREATYSQNSKNKPARADNALGIKGVHKCPYGKKYIAQIMSGGVKTYLGRFNTAEEAADAYKAAAKTIHREFAPND